MFNPVFIYLSSNYILQALQNHRTKELIMLHSRNVTFSLLTLWCIKQIEDLNCVVVVGHYYLLQCIIVDRWNNSQGNDILSFFTRNENSVGCNVMQRMIITNASYVKYRWFFIELPKTLLNHEIFSYLYYIQNLSTTEQSHDFNY